VQPLTKFLNQLFNKMLVLLINSTPKIKMYHNSLKRSRSMKLKCKFFKLLLPLWLSFKNRRMIYFRIYNYHPPREAWFLEATPLLLILQLPGSPIFRALINRQCHYRAKVPSSYPRLTHRNLVMHRTIGVPLTKLDRELLKKVLVMALKVTPKIVLCLLLLAQEFKVDRNP
jgi:hypothetical protein